MRSRLKESFFRRRRDGCELRGRYATSSDSQGTITDYSWLVNGMVYDSGVSPTVRVDTSGWTPGSFAPVVVTVTDANGLISSVRSQIWVNGPPTADSGGPYFAGPGNVVTLSGSANDPNAHGQITDYRWTVTNMATNISKTYDAGAQASFDLGTTDWDQGMYSVSLTVTDSAGLSGSGDTTVLWLNPSGPQSPTANAGGPYTFGDGPVMLDGSGSTDPQGWITDYRWEVSNKSTGGYLFIDAGASPTYSLSLPGLLGSASSYTVMLEVTDVWGLTSSSASTMILSGETSSYSDRDDGITASNASFAAGYGSSSVSGSLASYASSSTGATVRFSLSSPPANGSVQLNSDGTFVYTPTNGGIYGGDGFFYRVDDGSALSGNVLDDDSESGGAALSAYVSRGPAHGVLTLQGDGSFTYTPFAGFAGMDNFRYYATGGGVSAVGNVSITVNPPNVITAVDHRFTADDGNAVSGNVLYGDWDSLAHPLHTITSTFSTANGWVQLGGDGSFSYTPNNGFYGDDAFSYTAYDDYGASASGNVWITVSLSDNNAAQAGTASNSAASQSGNGSTADVSGASASAMIGVTASANAVSQATSDVSQSGSTITPTEEAAASDPAAAPTSPSATGDTGGTAQTQSGSISNVNLNNVPADRIRRMIADGLAKPSSDGKYVAVIVVCGNEVAYDLFEKSPKSVPNYGFMQPAAIDIPDSYFLVKQGYLASVGADGTVELSGEPLEQLIARFSTTKWVDNWAAQLAGQKQSNDQTKMCLRMEFECAMVPGVLTSDNLKAGNYGEAAISFTGDLTWFLTGPARILAQTPKAIKAMTLAAAGVQIGVGGVRTTQGVYALKDGDNQAAAGYLGQAAFCLFGGTTTAWAELRASSAAAGSAQSKFPASGFDVEVNPGGSIVGYNITYTGPENSGFLQTTFTKSTGELYIDVTKSQIQKQGLGQAMLTKAISAVEAAGGEVKSIAGNLMNVNKSELLSHGLEATPAYKWRVALGFTKVIVRPTKDNNYLLVMGRP